MKRHASPGGLAERESRSPLAIRVAPGRPGADDPTRLDLPLEELVRPDLRFHYATPLGASAWLDVCRDPSYGHDRLVRAASDVVPRLLDAALLERLLERKLLTSFIGIDSSRALLDVASVALAPVAAAHPHVGFELRHADFVALPPGDLALPPDSHPRLFLLLGLTLGNYAEATVLDAIRGLMRSRDRLVIDARTHTLGADADARTLREDQRAGLVACYNRPESRAFAFAPVAAVTHASVDQCMVEFELDQRFTDVPGALNMVMFVRDLRTRHRATGEPIARERLDLGVTTSYDASALVRWLESAGWRVEGAQETDAILRVLLAPSS